MDKKVKFIVDSSCSIPPAIAKQLGVDVLPYSINDLDGNIIIDEFTYDQKEKIASDLEKKIVYKTSLYAASKIEDLCTEYINTYDYVVYICSSTHFTGQYSATEYLNKKMLNKVFIINSNSAAAIIEEIFYELQILFKEQKEININIINDLVNKINNQSTTLFIAKSIDGLISSGRIPYPLIKILKITKVFPIIKTEEKNKPVTVTKNYDNSHIKLISIIENLFSNKLDKDNIKRIYILGSLLSKEKIQEIKTYICDKFKIISDLVLIRDVPLPIMVYTFRNSFGITVISKIKKS